MNKTDAKMLLQILDDARARVVGEWPADVKARSQETVDLVAMRFANEGVTESQLRKESR